MLVVEMLKLALAKLLNNRILMLTMMKIRETFGKVIGDTSLERTSY